MDDLISVIVPVYNIAVYLSKSIGSILRQTHTNIEVIAVDDGSQDDSLIILQEMRKKDGRLHVIHQENAGVAKARLAGIRAASGDWIGFVDGDDEIEPGMYEHLLRNAHQYHADISHCGYQMVFPNRIDYYYNTGRLVKQDHQSGLKELIDGSFIEPALCNKLFHKSLLQSLFNSGAIEMPYAQLEDLLWNYYLFSASRFSVFEDFCPYHYTIRQGSACISSVNESKLRDPLLVLKKMREETEDNPELQKLINGRIAGFLISLSTMDDKGQKELIQPYRKLARKELRETLPQLWREDYSKRIRILSTWTVIWPWSYKTAHKLYSKFKGTDKKYEIEEA